MNFEGILVGAATFIIIGICHPVVIKMEYHWGKESWWILAVVGLLFCVASVLSEGSTLSTILGACAFSCFWGIFEVFEQEERVLKGWFPMNPKRKEEYGKKLEEFEKKKKKQ